MEPKRLTDDDLTAIAARAEAATPGRWNRPYDALIDMQLEARLVVGNVAGYEIAICENRADAEFIAHARADIPALLAHADALAAENARLRDALAALVSTRDDDGSEPWFVKAPQGGVRCICCGEDFAYVGKFHHAPDCPIAAAKRALDDAP
jgi:hypothetical protein